MNRADYRVVDNGWSVAGMLRLQDRLPDSMMAETKLLLSQIRDVMDSCLKCLRPDGAFHDVVSKPKTFVEVNLSQMLCCSIFRGVAAGYLDSSYLKTTEIMRKAANVRVDKLGFVQNVCGLPHFDRAYFAPEGQAFYLLMETAAADLKKIRK